MKQSTSYERRCGSFDRCYAQCRAYRVRERDLTIADFERFAPTNEGRGLAERRRQAAYYAVHRRAKRVMLVANSEGHAFTKRDAPRGRWQWPEDEKLEREVSNRALLYLLQEARSRARRYEN